MNSSGKTRDWRANRLRKRQAPHFPSSARPIILVASALFATCSETPLSQAEMSEPALPVTNIEVTTPVDQATGVTITYLANEGFLFEAGGRAVLIDALFGDGLEGYPTVPEPIRDELENGRGRFSSINCVLATHFHGDHFNPWIVERFLYRVPAQFISTEQATEEIHMNRDEYKGPDPFGLRPARHEIESVDCGGIPVSAMSFHHGRLMVKNLAYLVDFEGFTILHVGDTEITAEEIRPWRLTDLNIDVALLPAWHLTEPAWRPVIEEIGAQHVIAMHLASPDAPSSWFGSAGSLENRIAEIRRTAPTAWIPTEAMEERVFGEEE